ncbi:putative phosphatase [Cronobacter phage EspYZU12]|nr:putative phosphatase [Cronobacter phage EspYZU15]WAK45633.1 putative phosphatase [Cronobacter phage EspYZU14]WBF78417.1 putative phosphatase [Cronobacter phage EspYZU12]
MSFKYKVGDLIEAVKNGEVNVFAHGCNCFCTMGSGIAPLIKEAFPKMYAADLKTEKGDKAKLGTFTVAFMKDGSLAGFNLYSQYGYNLRKQGLRDLDYNALYDSMVEMKKCLQAHTDGSMMDRKIGFPKIGAGLAGGDWNVIEAMIKSVFFDCDVTVYILPEKK